MVKLLKIKILGIILLLTFLIPTSSTFLVNSASINNKQSSNSVILPFPVKFNYIEREPILINNDTYFASLGFPGNGTENDPYIIENYNITATDDCSIRIEYTTAYFIIRNCYLQAGFLQSSIYLREIADNTSVIENNICIGNKISVSDCIDIIETGRTTIVNNYCTDGSNGIYAQYNSGPIYIADNTCVNNSVRGIYVRYSPSAIIQNNTCNNNGNQGIIIKNSDSSVISDNFCDRNQDVEIAIDYSVSCLVINNTCSNSADNLATDGRRYGMQIGYSGGSTIENNTFEKSGLYINENNLAGYLSYTVKSNTVNGKLLAYLINEEDLMLTSPDYGQIKLFNCSNIRISNQIFHDIPYEAIFIFESPEVFITNNIFNYIGWYAINAKTAPFCVITDNEFVNNYYRTIYVSDAEYLVIYENTFVSSYDYSIFSEYVDNCLISGNVFELSVNNDIFVGYSSKAEITENICDNSGIYVPEGYRAGLCLNLCNDSLVSHNSFYRYEGFGMEVYGADYTEIEYNLFQENKLYAIYLEGCFEDTIHHNTFQDNNYEDSVNFQVLDTNPGYNYWYDPSLQEGNYWNDWSGAGPYYLDLYPLGAPIVPPIVAEFNSSISFLLLLLMLPSIAGIYYYRRYKK